RIIDRNTSIPIKKSQVFTTAANFQTSVDVHVLQGEREMARHNKTLGKFKLSGIRRAPRGVPQIEVSFDIDANGIVNVSARDLGTGKAQAITIEASSSLSDEEIERAIRDAKRYQAEDARQKSEVSAKDDAERLIGQASSMLKGLDRDDKAAVEELIKAAKKAVKSKDAAQILAANEALRAAIEERTCSDS
ncbi:MAG TPA: Hsp70 family protein, partial [Spirochaetales bacterium]|nr:Hsp70 family protein [Spirochaetales bacterium]